MTMDHEEVESLLGAYALDAVDPDEAAAIEEHLAACPRCRAELAAHREVAAALGNDRDDAPLGLWDRIADQIAEAPRADRPSALIASLADRRRRPRRAFTALAAAAVVLVVALGLQIVHLDHQVHHLENTSSSEALDTAVAAALGARHTTIVLTSSSPTRDGSVIVAPNGTAYWIASDLPELSSRDTYQVWGLVHGKIVSLGLLGADAQRYGAFRVEPSTTMLMVTAEPEGGTPEPTSSVLLAGKVPHLS